MRRVAEVYKDDEGSITGPPDSTAGVEPVQVNPVTLALVFAKVSRDVVYRGSGRAIHDAAECAVRADRSSPAREYITAMRNGARRDDPGYQPPKDQDQIHDYAYLLKKIQHVVEFGEPSTRTDVNDLDDGVWEFKHSNRRLSYWDTPGDGTFTPKPRVKDFNSTTPGKFHPDDKWWYPEMDAVLRLGCAWEKDDDLAPPEKVQEALKIREEDAAHDRP